MNWSQAEVAAQDFWIRQESWPGPEMWRLWRGVWFWSDGGMPRVIQCTDYDERIFSAQDWTTMPKALAACPVDPETGSSGGGTHVPDVPVLPPPSGGAGSSPGVPSPSGSPPPMGGGGAPSPGGSPPKEATDKPKPAGCLMPSKELTVLNNCNWGLECELACTGFSPGLYGVVFIAADKQVQGGLQSGPDFVATATIPFDETYAGRDVTVYARITGFSGGPCAGAQITVEKVIHIQKPEECTNHACSTATQYFVSLSGVRINKDSPFNIRGAMAFSGICGPTGGTFVTGATMDGNANRRLTASLTFVCADGYYTATVHWSEPGGQSGTVFLTATPAPLGAPIANQFTGDDGQFADGAVMIGPWSY